MVTASIKKCVVQGRDSIDQDSNSIVILPIANKDPCDVVVNIMTTINQIEGSSASIIDQEEYDIIKAVVLDVSEATRLALENTEPTEDP